MNSRLFPFAAALAAFLLASPVARPANPADLPIPEIAFEKFVLSNGLTLLVHEDHKAPIVAVNLWYHVGSKNEKPGKTGFAHLFEHLMFNGSENFDDDYFKVLEKIGATALNGTTNEDRTNYFQNVPVSALDTVLWMESDRMGHLLGAVSQAKLDEQRGVVQNEKRQGENRPYGQANELTTAATYPKGHPYSWSVIGSMEDLNAATLGDVQEWFRTYYGPSNAVLVVAGDIAPAVAREKVQRYFGDIPPGPPVARFQSWIAKRTGVQRQVLEDRVPQARLYQVWNTPGTGSADDLRLDLVASILSSGKNSRLYKRLVYDDQIATAVTATEASGEIGSQFTIQATARPGADLAAVERAIVEELARFIAHGPTEEEVARAKTRQLAAFIRGVERIGGFGGKSDILASGFVYEGDPAAYRRHLAVIKASTTAELQDVAKRWLSDGVFVLEVRPFARLSASPAGADRNQRPVPGPAPVSSLPAFQRGELRNGLKLVVAQRHAIPTVGLWLLVDAGFASDHGGRPGTAKLATDMLDEGTASRSALAISGELQRLGSSLTTRSDLDTTTVALNALKANLEPSLDLLADIVLAPSFPAADFERLKKHALAAIDQESADPGAMAQRVLPGLIYGPGHAYSNPLSGSGTKAAVAALSRDDIAQWHAHWFQPQNATLVIVGDTTLAEIQPQLEQRFAAWKPAATPKKTLGPVPAKPAGAVYLLDRPGAIQSMVVATLATSPRNNPDSIPESVMNAILGGQFISRLNLNLREDKHWTYGARSAFLDARGPRPFLALAPVQTDKTKESVEEFLKELRGIGGEKPVTDDELQTAKNGLTLTLPGDWETNDAVARSLSEIVRFGFDDRYFDTYAEKVRATTPADVLRAGRTLDLARIVFVVVGDRSKIEAGLREIDALKGLEIRAIDTDGQLLPTTR